MPVAETEDALERLRRLGAVDDERFARRTAAALAARGLGDAAIMSRLVREGVDRTLAGDAVDALEPEAERAAALTVRKDPGARTARWLSARGFSVDSIAHALPSVAQTDAAELG